MEPVIIVDIPSKFDDFSNSRLGLHFKLRDELLYYTNFDDECERLCIFNAFEQEIFELAHDRQHHKSFYKSYDRIVNFIYIRYLFKYLRTYINHCSNCVFN